MHHDFAKASGCAADENVIGVGLNRSDEKFSAYNSVKINIKNRVGNKVGAGTVECGRENSNANSAASIFWTAVKRTQK